MSGRDVWLTTEHGSVVRSDRIVSLHLELVGPRVSSSPSDAVIVAEIGPEGRRVLVLTTAAVSAAVSLGDLLVAMSRARYSVGPVFIRAVEADDTSSERDTWRTTSEPPTGRWHVALLGDEPTGLSGRSSPPADE